MKLINSFLRKVTARHIRLLILTASFIFLILPYFNDIGKFIGIDINLKIDDNTTSILLNLGTEFLGAYLFSFIIEKQFQEEHNARGKIVDGIDYGLLIKNTPKIEHYFKILTTYIEIFVDDKDKKLKSDFLNAIENLLRRRRGRSIDIRFLILNPDSDATKQRAKDRRISIDKLSKNIKKTLYEFNNFNESLIEKGLNPIQIKIYDRLPQISLFQTDEKVSMAFYPPKKLMSEAKRFRFKIYSKLGEFISETFDEIWNDEDYSVSIEKYFCHEFNLQEADGRESNLKLSYIYHSDSSICLLLETPKHNPILSNFVHNKKVVLREKDSATSNEYICKEISLASIENDVVSKYGKNPFQIVYKLEPFDH